MVDYLNCYGYSDFDGQCRILVAHAAKLINAHEYERARGLLEGLAWFNRQAYDKVMIAYPVTVKNIMDSQPAAI